jgi:creatinine amidohydrolase
MRKSDLAEERGPARRVLDLAQAAGQVPALGPRARALVLQQEAVGRARDQDARRFEQALEEARDDVAAAAGSEDAPWGRYCTPAYVAMQEAAGWIELGQPGRAVTVIQRELPSIPAADQVDRGFFGARLARAYAQDAWTAPPRKRSPYGTRSWRQGRSARCVSSGGPARRWAASPRDRRCGPVLRRIRRPRPAAQPGARTAARPMSHYISTTTSADARAGDAAIAVLPVGSFEQHGDYLPLATDTIVACLIARRIAEDYRLFLLPPVTISCSHEHASFPGTVSVSAATISAIVGDVRESLRVRGIETLVVVSGHGGNYILSHLVLQANVSRRCMTLFPVCEDWDRARQDAGCASSTSQDMHAGELETSLLLHADPTLVRDGYARSDHLASPRPFLLVTGMAGYTSSGVIGLPSHGSADKGKAHPRQPLPVLRRPL